MEKNKVSSHETICNNIQDVSFFEESQMSDQEESLEERKKRLIRLKAAIIALTALGVLESETNTKKVLTRKDIEKARLRKDFDKAPITIENSHLASTKYRHEANQTLRAAGTYLAAIEKMQTAKQNSEKNPYTFKK